MDEIKRNLKSIDEIKKSSDYYLKIKMIQIKIINVANWMGRRSNLG